MILFYVSYSDSCGKRTGYLKNSQFYAALKFQFIKKHENNGKYAIRCLICKKVSHKICKEYMKRHRQLCGTKTDERIRAIKNKTDESDAIKIEFRDAVFIDENGERKNIVECGGCDISLCSIDSGALQTHK